MDTIQEKNEKLENLRSLSKNWGWAVYIGGVVVAWAFALAFFTSAFEGKVFLQIIIGIGVTLVSINAIVLANALHFYAVNGAHRWTAIGLYSLDLLLMIVNVLVSAGELTGKSPDWVKSYEPYAYATVVVPVITWGVLWILDPYHTTDVKKQAAREHFVLKVIKQAEQLIDSPDGQSLVADVAKNMAFSQLMDSKALVSQSAAPASMPPDDTGEVPAHVEEQLIGILKKAGLNGESKDIAAEILAIGNPTVASTRKK